MKTLSTQDLEAIYDILATTIDETDEDKQLLFLVKLVLLLANEVGEVAVINDAIKSAARLEG